MLGWTHKGVHLHLKVVVLFQSRVLLLFFDGLQVLHHRGIHDVALHFSIVSQHLFLRTGQTCANTYLWLHFHLNHIGLSGKGRLFNLFLLLLLFLKAQSADGGVVCIQHLVYDLIGDASLSIS